MTDPQDRVFRKTFHVPSKWMEHEQIVHLVNHAYAKEETTVTLQKLSDNLKELGYLEDNDAMVHDYLHFMIKDLLDKNGEVYVTEEDVREDEVIKKLLCGMTPDFVIKKKGDRQKTVILDIYVGSRPSTEVKSQYESLSFFGELVVVTPLDFQRRLKHVLPTEDTDYLYKNFQAFLTEYYYWRACMKLRKVLCNDVEDVPLHVFPPASPAHHATKSLFKIALAEYAAKVADQASI